MLMSEFVRDSQRLHSRGLATTGEVILQPRVAYRSEKHLLITSFQLFWVFI